MTFVVYRLEEDGERVDLLFTEDQHIADAMVDKFSACYPHAVVDYDLA